jgi:integrase
MARPRKRFKSIKKRSVVVGYFHEFPQSNGRARRLDLCGIDEALYKLTSHGKKLRSEREFNNYCNKLWEHKLSELRAQRAPAVVKSDYDVKSAAQKWLNNSKEFLKDHSWKLHKRTIKLYLQACGNHTLKHWDTDYNSLFKKHLEKQKKLKAEATVLSYFRMLQAFFNWCLEQGLIDKKITLSKPDVTERTPQIYSQDDLDMILEYLQEKRNPLWLRIHWMLRETGMRGSECRMLQLNHIHLKHGLIYLTDQESDDTIKGRSESFLAISEKLNAFLEEDLAGRGNQESWYLDKGLGSLAYYSVDSMGRAFRRINDHLGISRKIKPLHGYRATVITRLGVDLQWNVKEVQKLARHKDPSTTLGYMKAREDIETQRDMLNQL